MAHNSYTRRELLRSTVGAGAGTLAIGAFGTGLVRGQLNTVAFIGEVGTVRTSQSGPGQWHTQQLDGVFLTDPVVVMKPISPRGTHPCHVRLRNVTTDSFEYQIEEWNYLDGAHREERFFYIAVEPGVYTLSGLVTGIEAGKLSVNTISQSVNFLATYDRNPVVLTQPQTRNGPDAIVTRTEVVSANTFSVQLDEEEGGDGGGIQYHENEKVGYIAFGRPASGVLDPVLTEFEVGLTPNAVDDEFFEASFRNTYSHTPRLVADLQTRNGPDTSELRYRHLDKKGVDFRVEEEQSLDTETNHTTERVGYVVFGQDGLIPGIAVSI